MTDALTSKHQKMFQFIKVVCITLLFLNSQDWIQVQLPNFKCVNIIIAITFLYNQIDLKSKVFLKNDDILNNKLNRVIMAFKDSKKQVSKEQILSKPYFNDLTLNDKNGFKT